MKHVLWISRHTMTDDQISDLERALNDMVQIHQWPMIVGNVHELDWAIEQADAICAVLPVEKLSELLEIAGNRPVLVSKAKRERINGSPEIKFVHDGWYQMIRIVVEQKRV